jgi:peptide methionine sulfoxide reductase MsrA
MIQLLSIVQGNDIGTQYRSAIFYHDQKQKEIAEKSKSDLEKAGVYKNPIVTEITPFRDFMLQRTTTKITTRVLPQKMKKIKCVCSRIFDD